MIRFGFRLLLGMFIAGCGRPFWNPPPPPTVPPVPPPLSEGDIHRIELERSGCMGPCPIYRVTLTDSNLAYYRGERFAQFLGSYHAVYDTAAFRHMARLLMKDGVLETVHEPRYYPDLEVAVLRITYWRDSTITRAFGGYLADFQHLAMAAWRVDSIMARLAWTATTPSVHR